MPSKLESILLALTAAIDAATYATVERGSVLPTDVPPDGLVILRDGDPGEPEYTMSPMTWHYEHVAACEIYADAEDRDAAFDLLKRQIGTAIAADRTLGGLCDWVEAEAPATEDLPLEGGATTKAAIIPIRLHYATTDPLG